MNRDHELSLGCADPRLTGRLLEKSSKFRHSLIAVAVDVDARHNSIMSSETFP